MKPKIIKSEAENTAALARIEAIFDAKPGTPEGDELELLSTLVELYEKEAYPIESPNPLAAIRFRMEQANLKPKDLIPYLGSASKVSEVLSGKRVLSVTMMRSLSAGLGIPAAVLLQESAPLKRTAFATSRRSSYPSRRRNFRHVQKLQGFRLPA